MVQIKWNGRNAEDALNRAAFSQIRDNMAKAIREARCPEHGIGPTKVEVTGTDLKSLRWHVAGCCPDKLVKAGLRQFER